MKLKKLITILLSVCMIGIIFSCHHTREGVECCEKNSNSSFNFYEIVGPYKVLVDTTFHTSSLTAY